MNFSSKYRRCLSVVVRNAISPSPLSAEDLMACYGKQWRAGIENEPKASRIAIQAIDSDDNEDAQTV
jgi:hypothetical protein